MLVVPREIGVTVTIHVNVIVITGIGTRRGDLHGWASKGNMYYQIYIVSDVLLSMLVELPEVMIDVMVVEIGGLGIILHRVVDEEEEIIEWATERTTVLKDMVLQPELKTD